MSYKKIKAKFDSVCSTCGKALHEGDSIYFARYDADYYVPGDATCSKTCMAPILAAYEQMAAREAAARARKAEENRPIEEQEQIHGVKILAPNLRQHILHHSRYARRS